MRVFLHKPKMLCKNRSINNNNLHFQVMLWIFKHIGCLWILIEHIKMPYSSWQYFRSLNPTPCLTTTLLTINKQQIKSFLFCFVNKCSILTLKCYQDCNRIQIILNNTFHLTHKEMMVLFLQWCYIYAKCCGIVYGKRCLKYCSLFGN